VSHTTDREAAVQARVGDRIVVHSTHQGEPERTGQVLEVRGQSGAPPYVVRWDPDGHTGVFHPAAGSCAVVPEPANG
jgi:hypothetical protein